MTPDENLIFWDAGIIVGTEPPFDRWYRGGVLDSEWKGQWNHWVFTKNAALGIQSVYLNGVCWGVLTSGAWRTMNGIDTFRLGSSARGDTFYAGRIDEFRVLNVAQSSDWIKASFMNQASNGVFSAYGIVNKQLFGTLLWLK